MMFQSSLGVDVSLVVLLFWFAFNNETINILLLEFKESGAVATMEMFNHELVLSGLMVIVKRAILVVESSSCGKSIVDLKAMLACHLSYSYLQPADVENVLGTLSWQNG